MFVCMHMCIVCACVCTVYVYVYVCVYVCLHICMCVLLCVYVLVLCDNRDEKYYCYHDNIFNYREGNILGKNNNLLKFVATGKEIVLLKEEFILCMYSTGRNDLPDMHAWGRGPQAQGLVQTYQANHDCTCYMLCACPMAYVAMHMNVHMV